MKIKRVVCAAVALAAFSSAAHAAETPLYICAYYSGGGELLEANIVEEVPSEAEEYLSLNAPKDAETGSLYQWDDAMQPKSDPVKTEFEKDDWDGMFYAPYVTPEMCTLDFWRDKGMTTGDVIMTESEIKNLNRAILDEPKTNTIDLENLPEKFDGTSLAASLSNFKSPSGLYLDGKPVPESFYEDIRQNIKNAPVTERMPLLYGICVNRTVIKAYPYEEFLSDSQTDPEWDNLVSTGVFVNEPLAVYFTTEDGKFSYVKSVCCSGWVLSQDIAVCADKEEWESVINPKDFLVVTGEKVYLEASVDGDISEKMLTMGTVLELVRDYPGEVAYRLPWNNYVVKLPARKPDGSFYQKLAMIPANRDVHVGYLPYTTENVVSQALKSLGNRYGWGGMMDSQDCSSFAREVYCCFGFELPRNTTWQAEIPGKATDMSEMTEEEKKEFLNSAPAGTILQIPGHEMLYLGEDGGLYYTINDVSSIVSPEDPDGGIIRPRSVIVNDLSTLRSTGKTWLDDLSCAIVLK